MCLSVEHTRKGTSTCNGVQYAVRPYSLDCICETDFAKSYDFAKSVATLRNRTISRNR